MKDLEASPHSSLLECLDERASLCELSEEFWSPYCQHRFPVQEEVKLADTSFEMVRWTRPELELEPLRRCSYALQFTANQRLPWSFRELSESWVEDYELDHANRSHRDPEHVLSVHFQVSDEGLRMFAGVSPAADNLSPWSGGVCRIPRDKSSVSRAEQKLKEALELLPAECQKARGLALDLGAAPGGWSRVLAGAGYEVHAVDPAELAPLVSGLPAVTHYRTTAGAFLKNQPGPYKLIVCDMKMDAQMAASVMVDCRPQLAEDGVVILTLKLAKSEKARHQARRAVGVLEQSFSIIQARQLYFNRHEITVLARA